MKSGAELIAEERQRQIDAEGFSLQHDREHKLSEFIYAALAYIESAKVDVVDDELKLGFSEEEIMLKKNERGMFFPFGQAFWKPSTTKRDLIKAGALIAAAIDRLQYTEENND